jgi:hypothetical protein
VIVSSISLAGGELPDPRRELRLADLADLEAEAAQDAADAEFDVPQLGLQQLAPDQERAHLLRAGRLAVHRPEPAHAQQLRDAAGVLAVGLHNHGRKRRLHMPGLKQHGIVACPDQGRVQPLRQGAGLQADARQRQSEVVQEADQRLRLAGHLRLAHDPPRGVHHAHAALFQRHVDPGIMVHGCPSMMLGADHLGPRPSHHHSESPSGKFGLVIRVLRRGVAA